MIRKLLLATSLVAAMGFGFAQTQTVPLTTGSGPDAIARGTTSASVDQTVKLILPQATALHLDATVLTFDFTQQSSGAVGLPYACVYAVSEDVKSDLGWKFWSQEQVLPGGTSYDMASDGTVTISGDRPYNYPPALFADGELVEGSKNHFVCYQSFMIQLFSNFDNWDLQVERDDTGVDQPIEHLYVQGNVCSDYGEETGLYALNNGELVHLIPKTLTAGTTGDRVNETCGNVNTSWLDVKAVIAVKVNSDYHGESVAKLTYTLMSSDNDQLAANN